MKRVTQSDLSSLLMWGLVGICTLIACNTCMQCSFVSTIEIVWPKLNFQFHNLLSLIFAGL